MKKPCSIIILILFITVFSLTATAHSGRTDSAGGHYNHSTGDYHYHHGYPAHDHPNGECPYDNNIKISKSKNVEYDTSKNNEDNLVIIIYGAIFLIIILVSIIISAINHTNFFKVLGSSFLILLMLPYLILWGLYIVFAFIIKKIIYAFSPKEP